MPTGGWGRASPRPRLQNTASRPAPSPGAERHPAGGDAFAPILGSTLFAHRPQPPTLTYPHPRSSVSIRVPPRPRPNAPRRTYPDFPTSPPRTPAGLFPRRAKSPLDDPAPPKLKARSLLSRVSRHTSRFDSPTRRPDRPSGRPRGPSASPAFGTHRPPGRPRNRSVVPAAPPASRSPLHHLRVPVGSPVLTARPASLAPAASHLRERTWVEVAVRSGRAGVSPPRSGKVIRRRVAGGR
jgi:hypothetical protein